MKQFTIWIAITLLIVSIISLVYILFNPSPIQIILETGQAVSTKGTNYFTITSVMILIISSFLIGMCITYLFYNSDKIEKKEHTERYKDSSAKDSEEKLSAAKTTANYDIIIPLLRDDEKKAVHIIKEHNGEILQNDLVLKLNMSKVKTTRIIAALERKEIIIKQRHGLTNHIKLRH